MTEVPAADRLTHVVRSLAEHLPRQLETLLAFGRFEEGRAALARLAAPGAAERAVAELREGEAERLTALLLERWETIAPVVLEPTAIVVGPREVWVADQPRTVQYDVATIGLADGWTAEWSAGSNVLEVPVPDDEDVELRISVRVFGRAGGRRRIVTGERRVRARRPVVHVDPAGSHLVLTDHLGRRAARTELTVDGVLHVTDGDGRVDVDLPLRAGAVVLVDGQGATLGP